MFSVGRVIAVPKSASELAEARTFLAGVDCLELQSSDVKNNPVSSGGNALRLLRPGKGHAGVVRQGRF